MKKQLALLLLSIGISHAASTVYVDQFPPTLPYFGPIGSSVADFEIATQFVVPPATTAGGVQITYRMGLTGTATPGKLVFAIYDQAGTLPGTLIASEANTATISGTDDIVLTSSVSGSNALTSGTYWAAISFLSPIRGTLGAAITGTSGVVTAPTAARSVGGNSWNLLDFSSLGYVLAVKVTGLAADPNPGKGDTFEALPGVRFGTLYPATINDAYHLVFRASLSGSGVTAANNQAIFIYKNSASTVLARKGTPAPGTSGTFSSFGDPVINSHSDVAFMGSLGLNPTVTGSNNQALWTDLGSEPLRAAWREGDPAVGLPGRLFKSLTWMHLCDDGLYLGAKASGTSTVSGVWLYSGTTLTKVVAQQDAITLSGSVRTVRSITAPGGVLNGRVQSRLASPGGALILQINATDGRTEYVPFAPAP